MLLKHGESFSFSEYEKTYFGKKTDKNKELKREWKGFQEFTGNPQADIRLNFN